MTKNKVGRPTVITKKVLEKLQEAFLMGCTDVEATIYADISTANLYYYQKTHPEYIEDKKTWKLNPLLRARVAIYNSLDDPQIAWKLLCKKASDFKKDNSVSALSTSINSLVNSDREKYA